MRLWRTGHGPGSKSGYRSCLRTKSRSFWVGKSRSGVRIGEDTGTATGNRATLRNDERDDGGSTTSGPKHDRSIRESDSAVFSTEIETAGRATSRSLPPRSGHRGLRAGNARTAWRWRSVVASIEGCKPMNNTQVVVSWPSEPRESNMASTDGSPSLKRWPNGAAFG